MDHHSEGNKNNADSLEDLVRELEGENQHAKETNEASKIEEMPKIDVLNLPPRKEVHRQKKKKFSLKINRPSIRLFFVIIMAILVCLLVLYMWEEDLIDFIRNF